MMYAKKIKMQQGCSNSVNLQEIAEVYIDGCSSPGFFSKEILHNYLLKNPNSIQVGVSPYPYVIPETSSRGEKYVKSSPDHLSRDNLLSLPRV